MGKFYFRKFAVGIDDFSFEVFFELNEFCNEGIVGSAII